MNLRKKNKIIMGIFTIHILILANIGKFGSQNKGSIRKLSARAGAKEGKNIKLGIVDEVHEMKDNSLVMPIRQALSTQDEPIYIEITTDGFVDNGYLDERLTLAKQVLEGEQEKESRPKNDDKK